MRAANTGARITVSGDARITRVGAFLRRYKLDEVPQLFNVLKGDMSLVGPRPEVPDFVNLASPEWQMVLTVKPGITDLATLIYRNEEAILSTVSDPERHYSEVVLPAKLAVSIAFIRAASLWMECKLILCTVYYSVFPGRFDVNRVQQMFSLPAPVRGYSG
jgi:lipopolysaccharide/colanic/teichoic acid biosynthesis glycosyltransferase